MCSARCFPLQSHLRASGAQKGAFGSEPVPCNISKHISKPFLCFDATFAVRAESLKADASSRNIASHYLCTPSTTRDEVEHKANRSRCSILRKQRVSESSDYTGAHDGWPPVASYMLQPGISCLSLQKKRPINNSGTVDCKRSLQTRVYEMQKGSSGWV